MTTLNENTQKAQGMIHRYNVSKKSTIFDAYDRPSKEKINAYYKIKDEMNEVGGYGLRMTGAGSYIFSCAYLLKDNNVLYLIYHTPSDSYKIIYR